MDIIRENAGAESVVLVLESNGEYLVQGAKSAAGTARVLAGEPLRLSVACSTGIVNYVLRTSELVVLDDAAQQGKFRSDVYVINRRPKSVLCAPVAHKGKLIGAVYLENNQVAGAFTPDRLEALNILMSQVAVSISTFTWATSWCGHWMAWTSASPRANLSSLWARAAPAKAPCSMR
jgi:GAF domain-containing protein